jgi:hypothetical protein
MASIYTDQHLDLSDLLADAIGNRDKAMRDQLIELLKGTRHRADLDSTSSSDGTKQ